MVSTLTKLNFISITCERSLERKVLEILKKNGIKSTRLSEVRILEFSEETDVDLHGSQIKIECLANESTTQKIIEVFKNKYLSNRFDIGFFVAEASVLRPTIFFE
jgi:hypothetical protein